MSLGQFSHIRNKFTVDVDFVHPQVREGVMGCVTKSRFTSARDRRAARFRRTRRAPARGTDMTLVVTSALQELDITEMMSVLNKSANDEDERTAEAGHRGGHRGTESKDSCPRQQQLVLKERRGPRQEPQPSWEWAKSKKEQRDWDHTRHRLEQSPRHKEETSRSPSSPLQKVLGSWAPPVNDPRPPFKKVWTINPDRQFDIPWKMGINEGREHTLHWRRLNRLHHVKTWLTMMSHR